MNLPRPPFTAGYRRRVVLLLMGAYTFNAADRSVIAVIGQAMKVDLKLTDTQLGALAGTAFAALYALSGIPTARLAERYNRVTILALALGLWSALTAACALTGSYLQMVLMRVGVGVAEAGCSPSAHSLICDYYDRAHRASALSVYSCGLSLGYLFVSVLGGYVTLHYGWRGALLVVGLPGLLYALLLKWLIAEPPREPPGSGAAALPPFSWRAELEELAGTARTLFLSWPAANIVIGLILTSFASYGSYAFLPAYFNRAFGLDFAVIGVALGLVGSVPVALGILAGGTLSDRLGARHARGYALVPAAGLLLTGPLYLAALLQPQWRAAAVLLSLAGFFQYLAFAPSLGVIQNVVTSRQRATATALVFLALNVLALGGGSLFCGMLIDQLAQEHFAHSLAGGAFRHACPGGVAPAGAPPGLASACAAALVHGTRTGLMVTVGVHAWAAVHYLLGAFGLAAQLRRAAPAAA
jgi:predicted MFS family arabinose efflux permease